jgi:hypothetical protein
VGFVVSIHHLVEGGSGILTDIYAFVTRLKGLSEKLSTDIYLKVIYILAVILLFKEQFLSTLDTLLFLNI